MKKQRIDTIVSMIDIQPGDRVADIGSGNGSNIIRIAADSKPAEYFVEEIDSTKCSPTKFAKQITLLHANIPIGKFHFVYGTEKHTNLPAAYFDKVIMTGMAHEFTYAAEMFSDIKRCLKPSGFLFIEEPLVTHKVKKDKGCNNPYFTEAEFKKLLNENEIVIVEEKPVVGVGAVLFRKIYKCRAR